MPSGTATLIAGTALVLLPGVQTDSSFVVTYQGNPLSPFGSLYIQTVIPNIGFVIASSAYLDSNVVSWQVIIN